MAEGRRYSFEDARNRRARELEEALEDPPQVVRGNGGPRSAGLGRTAAEPASDLHWVRADHRERPTRAQDTAPATDTTTPEPAEAVDLRAVESEAIERVVAEARERIAQTAEAETRRIEERAAASHDEVRAAVGQLREHSELLDELTRLHATTTAQIEEVRALVVGVRDAQEQQPDLAAEAERQVAMVLEGLAPVAGGATLGSTPDRRGLDHEGRVVGIDTAADEHFGAAQRALEERLADLEAEVAESHPGAHAVPRIEEFEAALAAAADGFEAKLHAAADAHTRQLEQAGLVTKNQLLDALAQAETRLAQAGDARATDLDEMIAAARTTIERAANSRVESLETTAVELRDGIEELERDIATALTKTGEEQSAALDQAARDWLKRMENGSGPGRKFSSKLKRRGATAAVVAIAAALGGTLFLRNGGSDRPSVASANPPAHHAAPAKKAGGTSGDPSQVGQVADALSRIDWPSTTMAPLSWRAPSTGTGTAPTSPGTTGGAPATGAAPAGGGSAPAAPAPTQPPPRTSPPPSQPPPPTLLPPITVPLGGLG
ncbi:MAG TPA: hypothetical protein VKH17_04535 [Acidimicrobiia bacterium]|nr:hypothetical protein [Acidimicrobiia bacterium]